MLRNCQRLGPIPKITLVRVVPRAPMRAFDSNAKTQQQNYHTTQMIKAQRNKSRSKTSKKQHKTNNKQTLPRRWPVACAEAKVLQMP